MLRELRWQLNRVAIEIFTNSARQLTFHSPIGLCCRLHEYVRILIPNSDHRDAILLLSLMSFDG